MDVDREHSVDRLVAFTDAVVAIAVTLLVLPLADAFSVRTIDSSPYALLLALKTDEGRIGAFLLSFVLIARLWWSHHRLFAAVRHWTTLLVVLDLGWLLTIVIIPVTTAILPHYDTWPLSFALYTGTLVLSSLALTGLAALIQVSDAVTTEHTSETRNRLIGSAASLAAFALAFGLGLAVREVNFFALLLLAATGPFERLLRRHYDRRAGSRETRRSTPAPPS